MANNEIRSQEWVDKIEELVRQAECISDPNARRITIDLLRAVLDFHAAGLERILDITFESGPSWQAIIERIAGDDLVSSMLLLHDLHPDDLETRVNRAVQKLQDVFISLGARLTLISIELSTVRLRFESQRTWPGSPVKASVEKAILQAAPEITAVVIEGLEENLRLQGSSVSELLTGLPV